jgi:hypothetical protein
MIHTVLVEQMKVLALNWSSPSRILVGPDEAAHSMVMMRVKQRYVQDNRQS